jgi:hypothetical protein
MAAFLELRGPVLGKEIPDLGSESPGRRRSTSFPLANGDLTYLQKASDIDLEEMLLEPLSFQPGGQTQTR